MTARPEQWFELPQLAPLTFDVNRANCRGLDPELFHPGRGTAAKAHIIRAALAVCADCEVREPCRDYAIANRVSGIWGGTTGKERQTIRNAAGYAERRRVAECGTESGYNAHRRAGTAACPECLQAKAVAQAARVRKEAV
jgi:WhiB family redox-sensing transcriptional regulator